MSNGWTIKPGTGRLIKDGTEMTATAAELNLNVGLTATAAQLNALVAGTANVCIEIPDATTYTVLVANSNKAHILPDFTATCTISLPALATGLMYRFESQAVAADAQNWVFTAASGAFLLGGVAFADNDAGAGADEIHAGVYPNGSSHITLTVVTPAAGTYVSFRANAAATRWIVNGWVNSATVPAFS
jgi:hypothetical protein